MHRDDPHLSETAAPSSTRKRVIVEPRPAMRRPMRNLETYESPAAERAGGRLVAAGLLESERDALRRFWEARGLPWRSSFVESADDAVRLVEGADVRPITLAFRSPHDDGENEHALQQMLHVLPRHVPVFGIGDEQALTLDDDTAGRIRWLPALDGAHLPLIANACRVAELSDDLGMRDHGHVDEVGLIELFVSLDMRGESGALRLYRGTARRVIHLIDGRPVYAESSLLSENFGRYLFALGLIDESDYHRARVIQDRDGVRQGEAFVRMGAIAEEDLDDLLRQQIRAKIVNAFVPGVTGYVFDGFDTWSAPPAMHEFNTFEIIASATARTASQEQLETRWAELEDRRIVTQQLGLRLVEQVRDALDPTVWERLEAGCTVSRLFGDDPPARALRSRISIVDALLTTGVGVLCDTSENEERHARLMDDAALAEAQYEIVDVDAVEPEDAGSDPPEGDDRRRTEKRETLCDAEEAYRNGREHLARAEFAQAIKSFKSAQRQNPEEPLYRLYEGWAWCCSAMTTDDARWRRGERLLSRATYENPLMPDGYLMLARLALSKGDRVEALEHARMTLRLAPRHDEARALLASLRTRDEGQMH